ncbi:xylose ABC transporter ATP-binding protein [Fictibacillus enclensis]|uniref:xylose ABC transporter ATP-binding protein n=1 Tax=Fictibacillus enclensis TaxID=1017270 RepID=UPI0025A1B09A|nr:xylose ABC transporter ATP-binding protein [Fictibacillus enclensis]MDM5340584.1 xylose ABC transporter ATP-binding protein [Fictibacillus enclensis]
MDNDILVMKRISKDFPGVKALDEVTFSVKRGEIHALCGENGAGKSTLMKVLSGIYPPGTYDGDIIVNGEVKQFHTIKDSENAGISIIYQELALAPELTVAENIFLGNERAQKGIINWDQTNLEAKRWLDQVGLDISPEKKVKDLGVGQQQLVEIAKALSKKNDLIILDEPTAALTESEVETLIGILEELRRQNVTCIYISHKLNEVMRLCDSVTVLRDGKTIVTKPIDDMDEDKIIAYMVGRELTQLYPKKTGDYIGGPVLEVKNFNVYDYAGRHVIKDASFMARKGEVLGIAGLMGSGRTELFTSLFGAFEGKYSGEITIDGQKAFIKSAADAIKYGMAYVSEDRKKTGLVLDMSIRNNTTMVALDSVSGNGVIDEAKEVHEAEKYMKVFRTKAPSIETKVGTLSGGNQQKVVLGKWLMTSPKILILDEPTRGIDIGAKSEIYAFIHELAKQGISIIIISSELPEVLGMADRVLVMSEGRIAKELSIEEADQNTIMKWATGGAVHA